MQVNKDSHLFLPPHRTILNPMTSRPFTFASHSAAIDIDHGRDLDVGVDAVQERPADLLLVPGDHARGASAFVGVIAEVATRAGWTINHSRCFAQ
jgi:hypothetical protein